jgi:hypothetical protein
MDSIYCLPTTNHRPLVLEYIQIELEAAAFHAFNQCVDVLFLQVSFLSYFRRLILEYRDRTIAFINRLD